jgi:hypothetical protein
VFCNRFHCSWTSRLMCYSRVSEARFTSQGVYNAHNWHAWTTNNPHSTRPHAYKNDFLRMRGRVLLTATTSWLAHISYQHDCCL